MLGRCKPTCDSSYARQPGRLWRSGRRRPVQYRPMRHFSHCPPKALWLPGVSPVVEIRSPSNTETIALLTQCGHRERHPHGPQRPSSSTDPPSRKRRGTDGEVAWPHGRTTRRASPPPPAAQPIHHRPSHQTRTAHPARAVHSEISGTLPAHRPFPFARRQSRTVPASPLQRAPAPSERNPRKVGVRCVRLELSCQTIYLLRGGDLERDHGGRSALPTCRAGAEGTGTAVTYLGLH